jgi:cytochrome c-type biogenesis protein CcmH/NrfG
MRFPNHARLSVLAVMLVVIPFTATRNSASLWAAQDPLDAALETARKSHDETQLQSLKTRLAHKIAQNAEDADSYLALARRTPASGPARAANT